jgi:hypothetical protein
MSVIKLHLEHAEHCAIARYAETLGVQPEEIVYAATNRLMLASGQADVKRDIVETREWRRDNLPLWSDSACAVHAYEGKGDDEPAPARPRQHE